MRSTSSVLCIPFKRSLESTQEKLLCPESHCTYATVHVGVRVPKYPITVLIDKQFLQTKCALCYGVGLLILGGSCRAPRKGGKRCKTKITLASDAKQPTNEITKPRNSTAALSPTLDLDTIYNQIDAGSWPSGNDITFVTRKFDHR
jgi:hypothetical protein